MVVKLRRSNQRNRALTKIEVVVIVAAVAAAFFIFAILPVLMAARHGTKAINCINNLHQIGVAHRLWVDDLNNQFPLLSTLDNHPGIPTRKDSAYVLWQEMSNQLKTPKILICPADKKRTVAAGFATGFGNANVSYFLNAAAKTDQIGRAS